MNVRRATAGAASLALAFVAAACAPREHSFHLDGTGVATYTYLLPEKLQVPPPSAQPMPLAIELVLDEDLRSARHDLQIDQERFRTPIGEGLALHLEAVVRNVFPASVRVAKRSGALPALQPRVVAIEKTQPIGGAIQRLSVVLEWRFEDPAGRLIWIETVVASGERGRDRPAKTQRDLMRDLLLASFARSQAVLEESAEIRAFAASVETDETAARR